ncbi:hyaluronidase PH-20-like [Erinaceus europaeus]|uniref:Hyaluronidase n=1 Tax=Erinaceus europaeus TaxID=9365 RepID=A0A1S3AA20_ERIEU|nr:hyaluronidase PH-20-like [Erinaceus europaeus]
MGIRRSKHIIFMHFACVCDTFKTVLVFLPFAMYLTQDLRAPPILPNIPYLWVWNAPTEYCTKNHNVTVDTSYFSLVGSPQIHVKGQSIRIFYSDRLGNYPHISKNKIWHGGIPQSGDIQKHLEKAKTDIYLYLPVDDVGLAVIDWQEWRPLWSRNWDIKNIYRQMSIQLVQNQTSGLNARTINNTAKMNFETAGKNFMVETIKLGKRLRPKRYWGFYLFPDCYNYHYTKPNYTGHCFDIEKKRNDELNWLWSESTALYPSIYLSSKIKSSPLATLFVRNRIQEAIRVSKVRDVNDPLPVFIYSRPIYTDSPAQYLSQMDLVSTLGESVALGASGSILWGSLNFSQSKQSCMDLDNYMKTTLIPYMINVTLAAKMCSQVLCYSQGLCVRKNWDADHYLHLSSDRFYIEYGHCERYSVSGEPRFVDLKYFYEKFSCSCFANVTCHTRKDINDIDHINVCVGDNVCISSTQINRAKKISRRKGRLYKNLKNVLSSMPPGLISPCVPGKDVRTPQENARGQSIRIFYSDKLGYYPYVNSKNKVENGRIPQSGYLEDHLNKIEDDLALYLPVEDVGLVVIDWQECRPLWARNWDSKEIYRQMSIQLVQKQTPGLDARTINNNTAKMNFETA